MLSTGANLADRCLSNELAAENVIKRLLKTKAFMQNVSQTSPQILALHTHWCHFIAGL